ncbi:glycosyltransferase family 4 protein [uncultured Eudoraea sp.]|uniref:glycosyltransferase family 4 protein n=1 Tax=uncultured Eudoraea sp. TaxID=1035614 RepID=UPI002605322B|nr:glycosyltransferase family 4 protein [uncultured Eudoraea sp.]
MAYKINFITNSLQGGGAERVLSILANGLSEKGFRIKIICFKDEIAYQLNSEVEIIILKNKKRFIKNHTINRLILLLSHYRIRGNRPDLIISFCPAPSMVAIPTAIAYGMKIIVSEHINHLHIRSKVDVFTRKFLYRFAHALTVLTQFDIPYYERFRIKAYVMPNPLTFDLIQESNHKREKSIIAVGSLNRIHHKGFDNLIILIDPILKKYRNWKLRIVGTGEKGKEFLTNMALERNLLNQIEFTGFREDIKEIMANSSIFILPSRFEGLPMVLMEAMSQGMACIAYDCKTGPSDIINDQETGILVKDQDQSAMQNSLELLIQNEELRNKLSNNATKSLTRFSKESIMNQWEGLILKTLSH